MLVFTDKGPEGIERLSVSRAGIGQYYKAAWDPDRTDQWTRLGEIIKERSPKKIGINESDTFNYGDGITATLKKKLLAAVPAELQSRVQPAERLAIRWLERRTPDEMEVYPHIVAIAHAIIAEAFSRTVITPGVTTTDDVVWYFRERSRQLGLDQLVPAERGHPAAEGHAVRPEPRHPPRRPAALRFRDHLPEPVHRHAAGGLRAEGRRGRGAEGSPGGVRQGQPAAGHPPGGDAGRG